MPNITDADKRAALRAAVIEAYSHCKAYVAADNRIASAQLVVTAVLFFSLLGVMFWLSPLDFPVVFALALPAGGLLTRFFALQHDCGHGSFFAQRRLNEITGNFISILTFTPHDHWRNCHAIHHASSGNLDRRGIGDLETATVAEFLAMSPAGRLKYRVMRHPLVALVFGPPLYFLILQRWPFFRRGGKLQFLPGVVLHSMVILAVYGLLFWVFGASLTLAVMLPTILIAAWIGGWLFYVQHQFENTMWESGDRWDVKIAALKGSSHLQLPAILNWFTCDIGLHHIHHLASRIPNYRLRACLNGSELLQTIAPKLPIRSALATMHLALWDEADRRLISFAEFKRLPQPVG